MVLMNLSSTAKSSAKTKGKLYIPASTWIAERRLITLSPAFHLHQRMEGRGPHGTVGFVNDLFRGLRNCSHRNGVAHRICGEVEILHVGDPKFAHTLLGKE